MNRRSLLLTLLAGSALATSPAFAQVEGNFWNGGGIRIGDSTTTCDASIEGSIRYNDTANLMQFCNGTAWGNIASAGSGVLSGLTAAAADNTIANAAWNQVWNWQLTGAETGLTFGETAASTGGSSDQYILSAATLASSTAIPLYIKNLGAGLSFRVDDVASDTTPFVIDASGNVGIGTAAPATALDVSKATGGVVHLTQGRQATTANYTVAPTIYAIRFDDGVNLPSYIYQTSSSNDQGDLVLQAGRVWLDGYALNLNGSKIEAVGQVLSVAGGNIYSFNQTDAIYGGTSTLDIYPSIDATKPVLIRNTRVTDSATSQAFVLKSVASLSNSAARFFTLDNNGTSLFTVMASGNVGIGTTSPAANLHIASSGDVKVIAETTSAAYAGFRWKNPTRSWVSQVESGTGLWRIVDEDSQTVPFSIEAGAPDNRLYIKSTGNVGVGTITPSYLLSLDGDTAAQTIGMERETTAATAGRALTLLAGGAKSGGTNLAGGDLALSSGTATGNGSSSVLFKTVISAQGTGTTDRAPATSMTLAGNALTLPSGPTTEQPGAAGMQASVAGMIRYDTTLNKFQVYQAGSWQDMITSGSGGLPTALNSITSAVAANTLTGNADFAQAWKWTLTTAAKSGMEFGEQAAATNGVGAQSVVKMSALAASTAMPLWIINAGAANSFQVDDVASDATPFVIDATGQVGIANAAPTDQLTVGNHSVAGNKSLGVDAPASNAAQLQFYKDGVAKGRMYTNASAVTILESGIGGYDVTLTGSAIGFFTSSPTNALSLGNQQARKLWIENTATDVVGRALTVAAGSTVAGTSVSDVTGGNLILQSGLGTGAGASTISFQTGTTLGAGTTLQTMSTKMTILGSGNVGIGATTPTSKLHVVGTTNINAGSLLIDGASSGLTNKQIYVTGTLTGTSTTAVRIDTAIDDANSGNARALDLSSTFTTPASTVVPLVAQMVVNAATITPGSGGSVTTGAGIYVGGPSTGAANNYSIYSNSGTIYSGGNVGIGTTSPAATLDVNGYAKLKINASAPATCNAAHEGSIAYTGTTTHYLCFCDGATWQQASTPASACAW